MLAAQELLARAEFEYLQSQLTYNLALVNLKRATGVLLMHEQVDVHRECICNLPTQILNKPRLQGNDGFTIEEVVAPHLNATEIPMPTDLSP